jgi:hypothetical protein
MAILEEPVRGILPVMKILMANGQKDTRFFTESYIIIQS